MSKSIWKVSHTETTTAIPEAIWQRWASVEKWPEEDKNLEWARLEGEFAVGSTVVMQPKGSPKSKVKIVEMTPMKSFSSEGSIPFGKLRVSHHVRAVSKGKTSFTHEISLSGPLRGIFVKMFAQKLGNDLPEKMKNIARLAEKR